MHDHTNESITVRGDAIKVIAKGHLNLECLEERHNDNLDFSEQSVLDLVAALEAAYEAGRSSQFHFSARDVLKSLRADNDRTKRLLTSQS